MIGIRTGIGIDGVGVRKGALLNQNFNSIKSSFAFVSDGTIIGSQLTDQSGNNRHGKATTNLVSDGDAEFGSVCSLYSAPVVLNENSTADKHSGTRSFHVITAVDANSGIYSKKFRTVAGETYTYSFWIKRIVNRFISCIIFGGVSGQRVNTGGLSPALNTWVNFTGTYTETGTGSNAFVAFVGQTGYEIEFYIDDLQVYKTDGSVLAYEMANDATLKAIDTTNYWFDTAGIPLRKRNDITPLATANDKVFHLGNKVLLQGNLMPAVNLDLVLEWLTGTYTAYQHFTVERTIVANATDKHFGFGGLIFVGNRMYCFYRDAFGHNSYDGICKEVHSDNYGATWSNPVTVYDASEINSGAEFKDVRDIRPLMLPNGDIGLFCFVAVGHTASLVYPGVNSRTDVKYITPLISIPLIGDDLDLGNKTISTIWDDGKLSKGSLGYTVKGNDIYAAIVQYGTPFGTYMHKSTDNGLTWSRISTSIFPEYPASIDESAIIFSGETLYMITRYTGTGSGIKSYVKKSDDYGITWGVPAEIAMNWGGPFAMPLSDGKLLVFGRNSAGVYINIQKLDGLALSGTPINILTYTTSDCGYGNVVKHGKTYYFCYGNGPVNPNLTNMSFVGMRFKEIVGKNIEDYNS